MITASVVVHKTSVYQLKKLMASMLTSSIDKIYIVDNSPTDELRNISEGFPKTEYIFTENKGFGAAHNIGIKKAMYEGARYHLVVNPDVFWEGDIIKELESYMSIHNNIGLIGPKTYYPDGRLQDTCRMLPSPMDMLLRAFIPAKLYKKRTRKYLLKDFDHNRSLNCPYLLGSFMFFRIEALKKEGLFDQHFFMYPEDIDITRRIHEHWQTLYYPYVSIVHEHQQASKKSLKMFGIHLKNMVKYFNKWGWLYDINRMDANKRLMKEIRKQNHL